MGEIIDLRSRPALLHDFYGATPGSAGEAGARWLSGRTGSRDPGHFAPSRSKAGYLAEIAAAGISRAVVVGRETPDLTVDNDAIYDLVAGESRLLGLASVDPVARGEAGTVAEIERAVGRLGLLGVNIEPGFGTPPRHADDPAFHPVYETCRRLRVPVFVMSGPTTPDLDFNHPNAIGRVARAYPDLPIVCYHGFYPRVQEVIGVALRYENVHLVPDMYLFAPGSGPYGEAANGVLADQFLFATSYPFRAMAQTVEDFLALGWKESVLERILAGNARRLLGLGAP